MPTLVPGDLWAGLVFLAALIVGLMIVASGQVFLAIREIALNTRRETADLQDQYTVLAMVATFNNIIGWIIAGLSIAALVLLPFT